MRTLSTSMLVMAVCLAGCRSTPLAPTTQESVLTTQPTTRPVAVTTVDAVAVPPAGWAPEPLKQDERHRHQLWISPSGNTAYGVIYMALPFSLSPRLLLEWGFLPNMKSTEGSAEIVGDVTNDTDRGGIRFRAKGGFNLVRAWMITRGNCGWAVYAGTANDAPIDEAELKSAEAARENTKVGVAEAQQ